jgi:glucans biosynthesis protein
MISRRHLMQIAAASQLSSMITPAQASAPGLHLGEAEPFSYDGLKARVAELAKKPYVPPPRPNPDVVTHMNYDTARDLTFNPDLALYGRGTGPYPVTFLAVGQLFLKTVRMHVIEGHEAREILFRHYYFHHGEEDPLGKLPTDPSPMAGLEFRQAYDTPDWKDHEGWARFIGASYFRGVGESNQFGLSARGVAQNTGVANPEEFPDFTHFWIEGGATEKDPVHLYAILDGPSIVGAYRFIMHREPGVTMQISCDLHLRNKIERLGIAPLTSMFWYSETLKPLAEDWRPEVHDSDGIAIWTSQDEHIWRPLNSPKHLMISSFLDDSPRGFGLMQRDKNYDHYLDGVYYEKRPCGWIEPMGKWGPGSVQLVEIPTANEIYDNIIVFWVPKEPTVAGQHLHFDYRLLWRDKDPFPGPLALCVATRLGQGGIQGAPRSKTLRKIIVEFQGAPFNRLPDGEIPESVLTASRGKFLNIVTEPSPDGDASHWRVQFDLDVDVEGGPVELRCFMRFKGETLTETWAYQYHPFVTPW